MDNSLELLYQALGSELGIVIQVSDFTIAQQRLYQARKKSGDVELLALQFRRSPHGDPNEIWIVKGQSPLDV